MSLRAAFALGLLACGGGGLAPAPAAAPIGNTSPAVDEPIPHQATRAQLRDLLQRGVLTEVELEATGERFTYGAADGEVAQADDQLRVASCGPEPHTFLVDAQQRLYLVPLQDPGGGGGGTELREVDVPPCTEVTYALAPGLRWAYRIDLR